ncbi:MAG: adenylosuccinate synthetase, partial [Chloroflexota bacterium]|nr:adenylosuccinate synthetase [Chloroflexota bacterium]
MPAFGILGAQWGDEGKGKIVDVLAERATMVVRFSGGNNAGHTVINHKGEFKLHLVPSGVFWRHVTPVIAAGVVVDLAQLIEEIDALEERGVDTTRLLLSDHAHVVMPYHVQLDHLEEQARGNNAIGTTGRGIGPAYVDKAARVGVRVGDLLDEAYLADRLEPVVAQKNALLTKVYGA